MRFATMTMPFAGALLLLGSAAVTPAQVVSLQPLVTDQDAVLEPAIVGEWDDLRITQAGDSEYEACLGEDELCVRFRLTRLAGELFADLRFGRIGKSGGELFPEDGLLLAMHVFARIQVEGDDLHIELMDREWFADQVKREQYPVHGVLKNTVVLVAPSDEVKQLVLRYASKSEAFSSEHVYHRHEPEPASAEKVVDK